MIKMKICYDPRFVLHLCNSFYQTQPHTIITNCTNCFNCVLHLSIHGNSHYSSSTHITADVEYNSGVTQAKHLTLFFTFFT